MLSKIEELFGYLGRGELDQFRNNLKPNLVNTPRVSKLYQYDYTQSRTFAVLYFEIQYELLLFRAMLLKAYDAFQMLLDCGADLLLKEKFDRTDNEVGPRGQLVPRRKVLETDMALTCVTNSKDIRFIQMTFDHICTHALYEKTVFIEFLLDHLHEVNLDKFNPRFLKIDVGNDLPRQFEDTDEYKAFLVENGIDISGFFFFKSEYIEYLVNPMNQVDKKLLEHALRVCEFSLEETRQIYQGLSTERLKWVVLSHAPNVDPDLLRGIDEIFEEVERVKKVEEVEEIEEEREEKAPSKKRRSSGPELDDGVPIPVQIRPVDEQEYNRLEKRLGLLQSTIEKLKEKHKLSSKEREKLQASQKSLVECKARFLANPVNKKKRMEESLKPSQDLPEAIDGSEDQQSFSSPN